MFKITSKFEIAFLKLNKIIPVKKELTIMGLTYFVNEQQYETIRRMYSGEIKVDLFRYNLCLLEAEDEIKNTEEEQV